MGAAVAVAERKVAVACETCGLGQRGDRDGDLTKAKEWDGKTFAVVVGDKVFGPDGRELECQDCIAAAVKAAKGGK